MKRSEARRLLGDDLYAFVEQDGQRFFDLLASHEKKTKNLGRALAFTFDQLETEVGLSRRLALHYVILRRNVEIDGDRLELRASDLPCRDIELDAILFRALLAKRGGRLDCAKTEVEATGQLVIETMKEIQTKLGDERARLLAVHMKERLEG